MPTPRPAAPPHMITISSWTVLKVLLILISIALLWFLRDVVAILFMALLLAALIDPFAEWFAKRHVPRAAAVIIVYVILLLLAALVLLLIIPPLIVQVTQLVSNFASTYETATKSIGQFQAWSVQYGLGENFQASLKTLQDGVTKSVTGLFSTITGFVGGVATAVLVAVLAFYMVVEENTARRFFKSLAPEEYQPFLSNLFSKMQKRIGSWLRGQIVLGLVVGSAMYLGLIILHVPYALVLGIIAGLLEVIPYAGPIISAIPIAIIAFSVAPLKGVFALILVFAVQQLENNFLVPKIMQKATGLNPIVSIVALLIGIKLGGVLGAILAIPLAAVLSVLLEELFASHVISGPEKS